MELILEGDPAFKPVYLRSSLGSDVTHSPEEESSSNMSSDGSTSSAATAGHVTKKSTNREREKVKT